MRIRRSNNKKRKEKEVTKKKDQDIATDSAAVDITVTTTLNKFLPS